MHQYENKHRIMKAASASKGRQPYFVYSELLKCDPRCLSSFGESIPILTLQPPPPEPPWNPPPILFLSAEDMWLSQLG